jgi:hypothetical protein
MSVTLVKSDRIFLDGANGLGGSGSLNVYLLLGLAIRFFGSFWFLGFLEKLDSRKIDLKYAPRICRTENFGSV